MGDVFNEQLIKRKQTLKDTAIRVCLIILVILILILSFSLIGPQLGVIVTAAAGFGAAYLMSFFKVEYEYVFTNGELDIDVIYNQSRRKRIFSAHVNDIEIMAHAEDRNHESEFANFQDLKDYSTGEITPNTYMFMINYKSKRTKVIIEPNEKMMKAISGVLTRRKLHMRP